MSGGAIERERRVLLQLVDEVFAYEASELEFAVCGDEMACERAQLVDHGLVELDAVAAQLVDNAHQKGERVARRHRGRARLLLARAQPFQVELFVESRRRRRRRARSSSSSSSWKTAVLKSFDEQAIANDELVDELAALAHGSIGGQKGLLEQQLAGQRRRELARGHCRVVAVAYAAAAIVSVAAGAVRGGRVARCGQHDQDVKMSAAQDATSTAVAGVVVVVVCRAWSGRRLILEQMRDAQQAEHIGRRRRAASSPCAFLTLLASLEKRLSGFVFFLIYNLTIS